MTLEQLAQRVDLLSKGIHKIRNDLQVWLVEADELKKEIQRLKADLSKPDGPT